MITLGIDLASQSTRTGLCRISWTGGQAEASLVGRATDADILDAAADAAKVGIDAPLGWPVAFAEAVHQHSTTGRWPASYVHSENAPYRYRRTDRWVWSLSATSPVGRRAGPPLSVSTDRIGIPAMRAVALIGRLPDAPVPIDGSGRVVEAYPAGALRRWGFTATGYKGRSGAPVRAALVTAFLAATASWLRLGEDDRARCIEDDNAFDALLTALIARAAALDLTEPVPAGDRELARREGWIALPRPDSLHSLAH